MLWIVLLVLLIPFISGRVVVFEGGVADYVIRDEAVNVGWESYCGDGICVYGEDCGNCAEDCGGCKVVFGEVVDSDSLLREGFNDAGVFEGGEYEEVVVNYNICERGDLKCFFDEYYTWLIYGFSFFVLYLTWFRRKRR